MRGYARAAGRWSAESLHLVAQLVRGGLPPCATGARTARASAPTPSRLGPYFAVARELCCAVVKRGWKKNIGQYFDREHLTTASLDMPSSTQTNRSPRLPPNGSLLPKLNGQRHRTRGAGLSWTASTKRPLGPPHRGQAVVCSCHNHALSDSGLCSADIARKMANLSLQGIPPWSLHMAIVLAISMSWLLCTVPLGTGRDWALGGHWAGTGPLTS